eukprot:365823-Chlamydomonas_euryale.AAC.10
MRNCAEAQIKGAETVPRSSACPVDLTLVANRRLVSVSYADASSGAACTNMSTLPPGDSAGFSRYVSLELR